MLKIKTKRFFDNLFIGDYQFDLRKIGLCLKKWRERMKKKVNDVKDMVVSVEFNPIEIGFIQASIDTYMKKAREKFGDKEGLVNLPLIEPVGKICLGKFDKAVEKLDSLYEVGE